MAATRLIRAALGSGPEWSDPLVARGDRPVYVNVSGAFVGKVTLQRSHDDGATWADVRVYLPGWAPGHVDNAVEGAWYRLGFASAADYTSGTAETEMAQ